MLSNLKETFWDREPRFGMLLSGSVPASSGSAAKLQKSASAVEKSGAPPASLPSSELLAGLLISNATALSWNIFLSIFMLFLFWGILNATAYELLHFAYKCLWLLISNATTYELESIPSNTLQSKAGIDIH